MSFDKRWPRRKDWRKTEYWGGGRFDRSCRPHGGCPQCTRKRLRYRRIFRDIAKDQEVSS